MAISQDIQNQLHNLGISTAQAGLMGGGVFLGLILPLLLNVKKKSQGSFHLLGIGTFMAGAAWFLVDKTKATSKYTRIPYIPQMYNRRFIPNASLQSLPRYI